MAYDGTLKFDTSVVTDGFKSGVSKLGSIAKTGLTAATAAIGAVSAALTTAGGYAIKVGSDFEAGMSQVAAISGATGEELDALTEKAKEMGAKTKFSATESAEAFNYMAMAGWKTEDMLNGIEGIMDLAAASGEDLAMVSDIVTDALTAFGMEAKDSGHFADVLAAAASNSNTNVGKMGYTFKYVAPIAGAMKYSIEDTAVAIGLMANAGIKGEQAGTSLRGMLTRLVKPTDAVAGAMEELGICMTNADGSMRPLDDVIGDLRTSFSKLSDSEKTYYAATIAGQEAMSGMLAIVNASESDFNKLTAAINGADGAAKTTAETMQDNLKGAIEELSGSAETLGLEIYEELQTPLKEAALKGVEYVNQITEAFQSGGLEAAVMEAGNIFGELAVKAAEQAPKMIDAAVNFVQSFIQGIADNKDKLLTAAKNIVSALVNGLVKLLPKEIQKPVKETIDILKKSFQDGGLRSAINTVRTTLQNLGKVVTNLAKALLPPLAKAVDFLADNLDILLPLVTGIVAALKTMSIVKSITTWVTGLKTALGLATVATQGATTAQLALNGAMSANPIGIVIGLVGGLATALGTLWATTDQATESTDRYNESFSGLSDSFSDIGEGIANFHSSLSQAGDYLDAFDDTMFTTAEAQQALADNMQAVQDGITTICRTAAEERRGYTAEEITQLGEYFDQLNELTKQQLDVQLRKLETVQNVSIEEARTFEGTSSEYLAQAKKQINTAKQQRDAVIDLAEQQYVAELALLEQAYKDRGAISAAEYETRKKQAEEDRDRAIQTAKEQCAAVVTQWQEGYLQRADEFNAWLEKQRELQDQEAAENQNHSNELQRIENERNAKLEEIDNNAFLTKSQKIAASQTWNEHYNGLIEEENNRHQKELDGIYDKMGEDMTDLEKEQAKAWGGLVIETDEAGGKLSIEANEASDTFLGAFDHLPEETKKDFENAIKKAIEGISGMAAALYEAGTNLVKGFLKRITGGLEEHSPSKAMKRIFGLAIEGGEIGVEDEAPSLYKQADKTAAGFLKRFSPKLDVSAMVAKMKAAVAAQHSAVAPAAEAAAFAFTQSSKASANTGQPEADGTYVAEVRVDLEGREIARATAPFMGAQLAFSGGI